MMAVCVFAVILEPHKLMLQVIWDVLYEIKWRLLVIPWAFFKILASIYSPGPYGPRPLRYFGPGPLTILKNILS